MLSQDKQTGGSVTQRKMLRAAVALFLERGYEKTTTADISKMAGMGQSSFYRAFPSKEALLLELVQRMFRGQFALAEEHSGEEDPVFLYAVETALQLHLAEPTEPLRELYVTAYSLPATAEYIYHGMTGRLQAMFGGYLPGARAEDFYELEIASGSIMRGFMSVPCSAAFPMEAKVSRFLDCTLKLYDVPPERRRAVIGAVLQMDLHAMAADIVQKTVQQVEMGLEAPEEGGEEQSPAR